MDQLKIEPSKGNVENVLIITDHFTRYAQAFSSKTEVALATAKLLWNNFILHYGFPSKIITDQGRNFESELIENLCQVAEVRKLRTSPYHSQTNGQCEHFNSTLFIMLGTLTPQQKKDWKSHVPTLVHTYNCIRNAATWFSPCHLLFGRKPRLPVDVEFGLQRRSQKGSLGESSYVSQLRRRLPTIRPNKWPRGNKLNTGSCMTWKGRCKIQDKWENEEYQVMGQPTPGVPVYTVNSVAGGSTRVLHRNLLLPLQGRIRPEDGMRGEGISDSEDEVEGGDGMPKVARAPCGRPRGPPSLKHVRI